MAISICLVSLDPHYQTWPLCWVPRTLGKGPIALGKMFAECYTRQSVFGEKNDGEDDFAECLFSGTRQRFYREQKSSWQNKVTRPGKGRWRLFCRVPDGKALGKHLNFAECLPSGTRQSHHVRRVPASRHSAKFECLPSTSTSTLGKLAPWGPRKHRFAECYCNCTRQTCQKKLPVFSRLWYHLIIKY